MGLPHPQKKPPHRKYMVKTERQVQRMLVREEGESASLCLIYVYQGHNVTVMQFVLGQKPSCIYPTVPGLICLCSPPLRPPCIKEAFFMLLARLDYIALIRCDCMIMKLRNSMSERLTRHKGLRLAKFLISSKCHRAHLGSESQPAGVSVLQWPPQESQGYLPSKC